MNIDTKLSSKQHEKVLKVISQKEILDMLDDIWLLTYHHSADLEVIPLTEVPYWYSELLEKTSNFSQKWGAKLAKIAEEST